ncbi:MAG: ABC transporter ATP-binding protein [Anaerolineae bacterium]|nr:ABC transporter ATP-binding protein [Anaerolineae bacterium]
MGRAVSSDDRLSGGAVRGEPVVETQDVSKVYRMGQVEVRALQHIHLRVDRGDFVAVMGASGSGKSTLMNILGCLDRPTSGRYLLEGQDVSELDRNELAMIRNQKIGFVFQRYNLLPRMSALKNVALPLLYSPDGYRGDEEGPEERAQQALNAVGLGDRAHHRPNELSGGEQQRVAIARALVNSPAIILADEPTGNLDSRSGLEIMALLEGLHQQGVTLIVVTHEDDIASFARRIVRLHDGEIVADEVR